jgi:hypothetical protein
VVRSISDDIYEALLHENREFSSMEILERFFKIETNNALMAVKVVEPILEKDLRFEKSGEDRWLAVKMRTVEELPLMEAPLVCFHIENAEALQKAVLSEGSGLGEGYAFLLLSGGKVRNDIQPKVYLKEIEKYILVPYDSRSLGFLKKVYRTVSPLSADIRVISIKVLIAALFPEKRIKTWDDIVRAFDIVNFYSSRSLSKAKTLRHLIEYILSAALERGVKSAGELLDLSRESEKEVDFSRYGFDQMWLRDLPQAPGIYLFSNRAGEVIYVGKALNLRLRVNSYFWSTDESEAKRRGILERLHTIEYRELGSDLEALIEEQKLIERYNPRFNTRRSIPEKMLSVPDRILIARALNRGELKLYFLSNRMPLKEMDYKGQESDPALLEILERMASGEGYMFDPLKIIAISYMKRYDRNLNIVDIDRYSGNEEVKKVIHQHCNALNDRVWEKSLYI